MNVRLERLRQHDDFVLCFSLSFCFSLWSTGGLDCSMDWIFVTECQRLSSISKDEAPWAGETTE